MPFCRPLLLRPVDPPSRKGLLKGPCLILPIQSNFLNDEYYQGMDESLSMSLLERFDAMETEAGEPERRIGTVVMQRDSKNRLGVKIGGAPSGVYVDRIDWDVATVLNGSLQVTPIG